MAKRAPRPRPTILDVARTAGVSPATVSNAINNRRYVEAHTKLRIDAAVARLGYTPNVHARRLRSTGIGTIGLFSSMPFAISGQASRLGFLMEIAATAAVTALESGFALLLVPPAGTGLPPFEELAIDAAIVLEPSVEDHYVEQLRKRGIPVVTIGRPCGAPAGIASIDIRSAETARLVLDHLRAMRSTRIALMIGTAQRNSYVETEAVYLETARLHDMQPVVVRVDEQGGEAAAYEATSRLLSAHASLDGIFAAVDTFASGALRALNEAGVAIPGAMRVATRYDGLRARESSPPLTAVDLHLGDVAARAVELLLEQKRSKGSSRKIVLAPLPVLVPRASTGS